MPCPKVITLNNCFLIVFWPRIYWLSLFQFPQIVYVKIFSDIFWLADKSSSIFSLQEKIPSTHSCVKLLVWAQQHPFPSFKSTFKALKRRCHIRFQFHQHFMSSFRTRRSQKCGKTLMTWLSICAFGIFERKHVVVINACFINFNIERLADFTT